MLNTFLLAVLLNSLLVVDRGERIALTNKYTGDVHSLAPGKHIIFPSLYSKKIYPTVTQSFSYTGKVLTKDKKKITIKIDFNYSIRYNTIATFHKLIGKNYKQVLIVPIVRQFVKKAVANYDEKYLVSKRPELTSLMEKYAALSIRENIIKKKSLYLNRLNYLLYNGRKNIISIPSVKVRVPVLNILTAKQKRYKIEKLDLSNPLHLKSDLVYDGLIDVENVYIESIHLSKEFVQEIERRERQKLR